MPPVSPEIGHRPTHRNPWLTWLVPIAIMALVFPLGAALGTTAFRTAPVTVLNFGYFLNLFSVFLMLRELALLAPDARPTWWHFVIPLYSMYWAATVVRDHVARIKLRHQKSAPRPAIAYALALPWALASDVNDLVGVPIEPV